MKTNIAILLVEYEHNNLEQLTEALENSGQDFLIRKVQLMGEYEEALTLFKPDIVISDNVPPAFEAPSAFRILKRISPETPFIIVSDAIGEENAVNLLKMGVTDYVLKDKLYQLTSKIHRSLKESHARAQNEVALRQLQRREEQLQKILELSLDIICTLNQDGSFVTMSAASKLMLDFMPEELTGRKVIELVHADDRESTEKALFDLANGIDLISFENRFIRKSGTPITLLWSARWDPDDKLGYCVIKDITNIRKAEEKIKTNERRFRALLQNSSDGLFLLDSDGTTLEVSSSARRILGYEESELYKSLKLDLIHPDDQSELVEAFNRVKENPEYIANIEFRFLIPDNTYKWLRTTIHNQLHEPAIGAIVLNFRDVTGRKQTEIALKESEARLKKAQAIGHIGNWEMNLVEKTTVWSDEMFRMYNVAKEDVEPSFDAFISFIHPEDRHGILDKICETSTFLHSGSLSFRIVRPDGEVRYVAVEARFDFDENRKPVRFFGIQQDITERKVVEIALEKSEEKYRNLFNLSPIPMWVYDTETLYFLDVNQAAIRHYGYSRDEFLQMTLKDIRPQSSLSEFEGIIKEVVKTGGFRQSISKHIKKDGELIHAEVHANFIDFNESKARMVVVTDISDRMNYIKAIEKQNLKLREIAWLQSHVVRAPVARILGVINILNNYTLDDINKTLLLNSLANSAQEMDDIIREIVLKAEQVSKHVLEEELTEK